MALVDVIMPQLGESIAEGTISKWHKKKGEAIGKDETLLEISTDKVDSEIPSPVAGIVADLLFPEQVTVSVMTVIARVETDANAAIVADDRSRLAQSSEIAPLKPAGTDIQDAFTPAEAAPVQNPVRETLAERREVQGARFYSPLVLNIAHKENIPLQELERIEGTGASGRVSKNDVLKYLERKRRGVTQQAASLGGAPAAGTGESLQQRLALEPAPVEARGREERIAMDAMRRSIAEHMVKSKHTSPHVYSVTEADVSKLVAYRERIKGDFERREGVKLTLTPFFLDAVVKALKEFPLLNSSLDGDTIVVKKDIHLGVAVALENGLIVPVIRHADGKNIAGLSRAVADLSARARSKKLLPDEVQGGTFTVTNPGMVGNLYGIPIINQPQAAILAVGVVKKRPVVVDDAIAIRSMVYLSLSYDHRVIDGLMGGKFLERIVSLLEHINAQLTV